jgi:mannonate dehydratase
MAYPMKYVKGFENSTPGIQVAATWIGKITKNTGSAGAFGFDMEAVKFLKQTGVEWVIIHDPPAYTLQEMKRLKVQIEDMGFKIFRLANNLFHNMSEIVLNLPCRDNKIDEYLQYITNLGEAGIFYSTYAHMGNGIWRNLVSRQIRGGAYGGGLDLKAENDGYWFTIDENGERVIKKFNWPLSHQRRYSETELWDNYEYFIKKVVPVAESAGVYIGIHPDDPPGIEIAGIPRRIFSSFDGYKRALEIADSSHIGACLCVGCWLEGAETVCSTPEQFIRYFGSRGKLFKVHMRNVTAPLSAPGGFVETYPDDGYYNLINVIETLDKIGFDGVMINDHLVDMAGGLYTCEAYFTAYLKGVVDTIQNQRKITV